MIIRTISDKMNNKAMSDKNGHSNFGVQIFDNYREEQYS